MPYPETDPLISAGSLDLGPERARETRFQR
jgi:hypothetical protein